MNLLIGLTVTFILIIIDIPFGEAFDLESRYRKDHCKPICACYMDGIYYEHGEQWQEKGVPCITYQCYDGFYKPILQGCSYKGKCKPLDEEWTEGCFTYKCKSYRGVTSYELIEGGCLDGSGNCLKVGEKVQDGCDTIECQIIGTCYNLITVGKGCLFAQSCKPLHSFWNDGCSVYQCINDTRRITTRLLEDDDMYWPEGNYSLLMSRFGCPRGVESEWEKGFRRHYGEGSSFVSQEFNAYGEYNEKYFEHHFCSHVDVHKLSRYPKYQTFWEQGRYCIFRRSGDCPKPFIDGYIIFDDVDLLEVLFETNGSLPDGNYSTNTKLSFCCRSDGYLDEPIVLPRDKPFILFLPAGESNCQTVRGMTYTVEYFTFANQFKNDSVYVNGSTPRVVYDKEGRSSVYFCHYKPLECDKKVKITKSDRSHKSYKEYKKESWSNTDTCVYHSGNRCEGVSIPCRPALRFGCTDADGNMIKPGERILKDCAWYMCYEELGIKFLAVVEGGCVYKDGCKKENATWEESSGESCYVKQCLRSTEGTKTIFTVNTKVMGCKDGDTCRPLGYVKTRGCYTLECKTRKSLVASVTYFYLRRAGCSDGKGGCVPLGQTFVRNCIVLKCRKEPSKCGLEYVSGACQFNGKCRAINSTWTASDGCHKLNCSMFKKNPTSYTFSVNVAEYGCKHQSKCLKSTEKVKEHCITRQCTVDSEHKMSYMKTLSGGCKVNGKCMDVGETFQDGCSVRKCFWQRNKHSFKIWTAYVKYGCKWYDECLELGDKRVKNCVTYTCLKGAQTADMKATSHDCSDGKGGCLSIGTSIEDSNCFTKRCTAKSGFAYMAIIKGGCKVDGTCRDHLFNWTDTTHCATFQCRVEKKGKTWHTGSVMVSVGCKIRGTCREHLSQWTESGGCATYQCKVERNGDKWNTNTPIVSGGCKWDKSCIAVGETRESQCATYTCKQMSNGEAKMMPVSYECSDGKDGCVKPGTMIRGSDCFKKKCKLFPGYAHMTIIEGGCKMGGVCVGNMQTWTEPVGCGVYQCRVSKNGLKWFASTKLVGAGCRIGNTCKTNGEEWEENKCSYKKCVVQKTASGFSRFLKKIPKGCTWGDGCLLPNEKKVHDCVTYLCKKWNNGSISLKPLHYECKGANGRCIKRGHTVETTDCFVRKCKVQSGHAHLPIVQRGCRFNGTCKKHLSKWTESVGCGKYQCRVGKNGNHWSAKTALIGAGCRWGNGCKQNGEEWKDSKCVIRKCLVQKTANGFRRNISAHPKGCLDFDGGCRNLGEVWDQIYMKKYCYRMNCQQEGNMMRPKVLYRLCIGETGKCHRC